MTLPAEYERIRSQLLRPAPRQVDLPVRQPCVASDAAPPLPDIASAFHYGNLGPELHEEVLEPLLDRLSPQLLVACSAHVLEMLLPFWEEFRQAALAALPALAIDPGPHYERDMTMARGWVDREYEHDIGGPPGTTEGFLRWLLDWPDRVLAQTREWISNPLSEPYPGMRAGAIFNAWREVALGYLERTISMQAEPRSAGWWTWEQVVRGLFSVMHWQADALRPTDFELQPHHEVNRLIRNRTRNCIASAASPIGWRVELQELRSRNWGMTRRLFGGSRGELIPARPGRLTPDQLTPELQERTRRIVTGFYARWWRECQCRFPLREGPGLVVEGPRKQSCVAREPHLEPDHDCTTRSLIEQLGFGRVEQDALLGSGGFGEAWLLPDGRVIKFTTSPAEIHCVEFLDRYGVQSRYLPRIEAFGTLAPGTAHWVDHSLDADDTAASLDPDIAARLRWQGWGPVFWYVREALDDVRPDDPRNVHDAILHLWSEYGILPMDIERVSNWGKRPGSKELVLRDLACSTPDAHFSARTDRKADRMVQHPARIRPSDVPSFLADRERGRPAPKVNQP